MIGNTPYQGIIQAGNIQDGAITTPKMAAGASAPALTSPDGVFKGTLYTGQNNPNLNGYNDPGITSFEVGGTPTNKPSVFSNQGHYFQITDANGNDVKTQFYAESGGNELAFQVQWGNGTNRGWKRLIHTDNFAAAAPSGTIIGMASSVYRSRTTGNTGFTFNSINYTPRLSNTQSKIVIAWQMNHGLYPKGSSPTVADAHGNRFYINWNGNNITLLEHDVYPTFANNGSYENEWYVNSVSGTMDLADEGYTWVGGSTYSIAQRIDVDNSVSGNWYLNRCQASDISRGRSGFTLFEVKL